ncbi:hypothetical protein IQ07DRAFT_342551 [Pyrenochaeta sp. DS3sAY3a]|nr:hypothetical protein IQ07DRAFT_342551 [Pyrenochaeta sp. DS3sAY3a]
MFILSYQSIYSRLITAPSKDRRRKAKQVFEMMAGESVVCGVRRQRQEERQRGTERLWLWFMCVRMDSRGEDLDKERELVGVRGPQRRWWCVGRRRVGDWEKGKGSTERKRKDKAQARYDRPMVKGEKRTGSLRNEAQGKRAHVPEIFNRKCSFQQHKCSRRKCSPSYHIQEPFRRALFLEVSKRCMRVKEREWQSLCILCCKIELIASCWREGREAPAEGQRGARLLSHSGLDLPTAFGSPVALPDWRAQCRRADSRSVRS